MVAVVEVVAGEAAVVVVEAAVEVAVVVRTIPISFHQPFTDSI
jgi:hypothetical protein